MNNTETCLDNQIIDNKISIGIVTYNSSNEIPLVLDSILQAEGFEEISVYIVDNASTDNSVEIIKKNYPWANLYKSNINLGFGKAHNLIINKIHSQYHIIVNPDIVVEKKCFNKIIKYMDENVDIVAATPFIMNMDGSQQFLPKKNPSMKYMIGGMFEKYSKYCKRLRDDYTLKNKEIHQPIDIDFCSGCFMITRTEAIKKVEGFDPKYFLHFEDADLTRKLKAIGRTVYNPNISVTHKWERDNKKLNKSFAIALKSMFIYMNKWR